MRSLGLKIVYFTGFFALCVQAYAQSIHEPAVLAIRDTGAYSILERSDWRRYDNGRYTGLVRNEVRATIIPQPARENDGASNGTVFYEGNFFVLQSTLRDMRHSAQAVDAVIPVSFQLQGNGALTIEDDRGFPVMRGFPAFPSQHVIPGFKWRAQGSRAADSLHTGNPLIVPFIAEYEYRGTEIYRDMRVHRIYAVYGNNYQNRNPVPGGIARVQGNHRVDILIRADNGLLVFMRDDMDETYTMLDGSAVQLRGFTLTFGEVIVLMDRVEVITALGNTLRIENRPDPGIVVSTPGPVAPPREPGIVPPVSEAEDQAVINTGLQDSGIDLVPVSEGIRLTIKDIRFVPDSAEFLPAERPRLDLIAEALKQIPERTFLVEGHTASTGNPSGEMNLSIERARRMVEELVRRGIDAGRFIYKGWGGTKPVGDNATNEGRSANRRVEITILE
jgi:outer membrane protein OmpA-like peptidoglycan-associated protein